MGKFPVVGKAIEELDSRPEWLFLPAIRQSAFYQTMLFLNMLFQNHVTQ